MGASLTNGRLGLASATPVMAELVSHTFTDWNLARPKFGIALEKTELFGLGGQTLESFKPVVAQTMLVSGIWMDGWTGFSGYWKWTV
jgi:hypothetical protein